MKSSRAFSLNILNLKERNQSRGRSFPTFSHFSERKTNPTNKNRKWAFPPRPQIYSNSYKKVFRFFENSYLIEILISAKCKVTFYKTYHEQCHVHPNWICSPKMHFNFKLYRVLRWKCHSIDERDQIIINDEVLWCHKEFSRI